MSISTDPLMVGVTSVASYYDDVYEKRRKVITGWKRIKGNPKYEVSPCLKIRKVGNLYHIVERRDQNAMDAKGRTGVDGKGRKVKIFDKDGKGYWVNPVEERIKAIGAIEKLGCLNVEHSYPSFRMHPKK